VLLLDSPQQPSGKAWEETTRHERTAGGVEGVEQLDNPLQLKRCREASRSPSERSRWSEAPVGECWVVEWVDVV
jgi:hypothetical protein